MDLFYRLSFQPSEFVKPFLIVILAYFISSKDKNKALFL